MTTQQKLYIRLVKRPIGFLGALVGIIILSPIMLGTMVLLLFANKNGFKGMLTSSKQGCTKDKSVRARLAAWFALVFFTQDRPGKGEKIFKVIKFKTMTDEKDENGKLLPDAQRLTKVGKFVRSTSIDELPQLINVLKGDMALIGPRPLRVHYLPLYSPEQHRRHEVRPGISGWAQCHGRNNISWTEKFKLDVWYVDHLSLKTDIKVILITIKKVLFREDVNNEAAATMYPFDGTN